MYYPEEIKEMAIERTLNAYKIKNNNKKKKKIYYIAGAYRANTIHETLENIRCAEEVAITVWKAGHVALCPHLNSRLMDGIVDDKDFLDGAIELLSRCDGMVLVPGWEKSHGTIEEIVFAMKEKISICEVKQLSEVEYVISEI